MINFLKYHFKKNAFSVVTLIFLIAGCESELPKDEIIHQYGSVTDVEGNVYRTIKIGSQVWMADNLKTAHYSNGDLIETTNPFDLNILSETKPKYQWAYEGDERNVGIYGRLYTWYVVTDERGLCPKGYHIPTNEEWKTLINYLGGENVAIHKLMEKGTTHWMLLNEKATNASGFSALPAGGRNAIGFYAGLGYGTDWWTSSFSGNKNYLWDITYLKDWLMFRNIENDWPTSRNSGYSIRCLKNQF